RGSACPTRRVRSALLAVSAAAPTAANPSRRQRKNNQLHPPLSTRFKARAATRPRNFAVSPRCCNRSTPAADVTAMSPYSVVHATGNTPLGGTYDGLRNREYQVSERVWLAALPLIAVAPTTADVAARMALFINAFLLRRPAPVLMGWRCDPRARL